jgi:actin related protein 2/3 complex subunit 5
MQQFKKEEDMNRALSDLPDDYVEVIMRYIYAGLASGDEKNADTYLKFHAAAVTRGGLGSICRVLSDTSRPVLI